MNLQGLYVATLTPFFFDESINYEDLQALVKLNCATNLNGLYVGGSTAEAFLCSTEERIEVLKATAEAATAGKTLIAHIGDISTRKSEALARAVSDLPYAAISAVTPFYYPVGFEQLKKHYQDIIQASGKPMVVYNFPAFAGMNLSVEQLSELLNIEGVIALKQTSANLYQMDQITRANPGKTVYNGFDEILASGLVAGAVGGIGSTYNIQAQRMIDIQGAILGGDTAQATRLQREANEVIDALVSGGVIPSLKYILKEKGVISSDTCRRPINEVSAESKAKLDVLMECGLC
ncbi:N-acetylneuraminate lyase [Vibrio aestuarianus]|uniref:N-acetylneuraminate lyase n=1 Tax=Vibrio aestuarianus TaxID=28171 RepID=UPI0006A60A9C|nr:N-acetylneuraminate lyase [Vibrio aestuarianus]KOE81897.1 N-acetylneuraminate lyase [Vibrio alginolyticus]MDE1323769.1 N-acetylneuraminate lyase [Vibrio aestuarianus]